MKNIQLLKLIIIFINFYSFIYSEVINELLSPFSTFSSNQTSLTKDEFELPILSNNERYKLKLAALNLILKIHKEKVDIILLSGSSAPLSKKLLLYAWNELYKNEPPPVIYTLSLETNSSFFLQFDASHVHAKGLINQTIEKSLQNDFTKLNIMNIKQKKILYLDDISNTGFKLLTVYQNLYRIGFNNLWIGCFISTEKALSHFDKFGLEHYLSGYTDEKLALKVLNKIVKQIKYPHFQNTLDHEIKLVFQTKVNFSS